MAPTLAKFFPDDTEERYMSRRPCLSCCLRGRSEMPVAAEGERTEAPAEADGAVAVADADAPADTACEAAALGRVLVECAAFVAAALTAFVMGVPAVVAPAAAGLGAAPAATGFAAAVGKGWPMGVS